LWEVFIFPSVSGGFLFGFSGFDGSCLVWTGYVCLGLIRRIYAGGVLVVEGVRSDVPFVVVPFSVLRCHVDG
jgi:hypothetical protein